MPPILDTFGTRLDPADLQAGLASFGVPGVALFLYDHEVVLEVAGAPVEGDAVSRCVTWVRGRFSPLMGCRVFPVPSLPQPVEIVDRRERLPIPLVFAEVFDARTELAPALDGLLARLGLPAVPGTPGVASAPRTPDAALSARLTQLGAAWGAALARFGRSGDDGTVSWVASEARGPKLLGGGRGPGPHLVALDRPGADRGERPALILAAAADPQALRWYLAALQDPPDALPDVPVLLDGVTWGVARRPMIAAPPVPGDTAQIRVSDDRCDACGLCAEVCPTDYLDAHGRPTDDDPARCIRCYDCVEACPTDALRPVYADDTAARGDLPSYADGFLARLRGAPGPTEPAPFPPSFLLPKPDAPAKPRVILGLAILTQQEHAAALVIDGELVGAVEEEKLVRIRHFGWSPRQGPRFRNLGVDPTLTLEQVLCRRSIRVLLGDHGLTLDDVDVIAVNGLPSRYRRALPVLEADAPIPTLTSGRLLALPHHLCHAASAYRVSGFDGAWILTVDGRGDRETAALFRADGDTITPQRTVLSLTDRSIGGVYETVTRLLGFGSHGQGSVMALASFGTPDDRLQPYLSAEGWDAVRVHEQGLQDALAPLARDRDAPLTDAHRDLAATLQDALERTLLTLAADALPDDVDALCLAGGVSLNCKANERLRTTVRPGGVFAQPGANDAGTALGAAAQGWSHHHGGNLAPMRHASLGPAFDDEAVEDALRKAGVAYTRVDDVAEAVADLLVEGQVVAWFQDRLEFGPRALGCRSILADPRSVAIRDRVNDLKTRERWRPFGPSILAGHEGDWFVDPFDSRFMLFTTTVREDRREAVPGIVHVDGTTRPQVVHAETHPRYHAMIAAFHARTGVPMVIDTSFNRRGEPIVCTPADALDSFVGLGADVLAIGSFLVRQGARAEAPAALDPSDDADLAALPGGRRLQLRLTTRCDLDCVHCTLRDHPAFGQAGADFEAAVRSLAEGRRAGCDALVILRGEATGRRDVVGVLQRARAMGYRAIQLQTHGRVLREAAGPLKDAGLDAVEVMLLGADAKTHDGVAQAPGAYRDVLAGLPAALRAGLAVFVSVPILRANAAQLDRIVRVVARLKVGRVHLQFPRPVERDDGVHTEHLLRLADAAAALDAVLPLCRELGLVVTTEGFPLCHLDPSLHGTPDATEDFGRHRIDDLGLVWDDVAEQRQGMRPDLAPCRACALADRCPKTWALYPELFGTGELRPLEA